MAAFDKGEYEKLMAKLETIVKRANSDSSDMSEVLLAAARIIELEAKLNVRELQLVRNDNSIMKAIESRLVNSQRAEVGTFDHRFAHVYEHGLPFTDNMRKAMFYKLRVSERFRENYSSKERIDMQRGAYRRAAYLGPALETKREEVLKILLERFTRGL